MSKTTRLEIPDEVIKAIEEHIVKVPGMVREKLVKNTFKECSELFERKVKQNIDGMKRHDRWGKPHTYPIRENIRTRQKNFSRTGAGVVIDLHGRIPELAQYATSVEYGHDKVVFGRRLEGRVEEQKFWRPAITSSEMPITQLIKRAMKRYEREMVYGGRK